MTAIQYTDVLILGAGCAGLSLATRLANARTHHRVTLLERRETYVRDRTWCFWDLLEHPFRDAITHRWSRFQVRNERTVVDRAIAGVPYVHLDAQKFYALAQQQIAAHDRIALHTGVTVDAVEAQRDHVLVKTAAGDTWQASLVLDARPPRFERAAPSHDIRWLQHFKGLRIRVEHDHFDPGAAMLMDFRVPQTPAVHFLYVLPFSRREALVEATWFSPSVLNDAAYDEALTLGLRSTLGLQQWQVLDHERGVLPMTTEALDATDSRRVRRIGLGGGAAKPSTGYAFLAIQRHAARMAAALARVADPADVPRIAQRSQRTLLLDRVFLSYLQRYPSRGADVFVQLFERAPASTLVKFLSETSSAAEDLRVMRSVDIGPFATETMRVLGSLMRAAT